MTCPSIHASLCRSHQPVCILSVRLLELLNHLYKTTARDTYMPCPLRWNNGLQYSSVGGINFPIIQARSRVLPRVQLELHPLHIFMFLMVRAQLTVSKCRDCMERRSPTR